MKLWRIAGGLALIVLWAGSNTALAQHKSGRVEKSGQPDQRAEKESKLPLCPVMGESIDFNVKTATDEGPVYFCCAGCVEKFEKDPQKYAKKVAAQRQALKKLPRVQVNCPLNGEPVDRKVFAEQDGRKVYFCGAGCQKSYEKAPAKYAAKLEASYTYQTRCPVMGGAINPTSFSDLPTGQRIYFCCPGCDKKLLADPEKYAPKLAAQGVNIDVKKLKAALAKGKKKAHEHGEHDHGDHGEHDKP